MMTPRERLTAALRRQPVDRMAWTVDLAYYNQAMREQGRFDARCEGVEGFLRQHEQLGADPYLCYDCFWAHETIYDGVIRETSREKGRQTTRYGLGEKSLVAETRYLPASFCWAPCKHSVETVEDLELLLAILRRGRMVPQVQRHRQLQQQWQQRGLLALGVPRTPIPALIAEWCGITATAYLYADAPDLFAEVAGELDRLCDPVFDAVAEYRPVAVHFPDNISGENVGSFWERFMAPVYRRRVGQMHDAGIVCAIHNDGTVGNVLGRIAAVGFDAAESITPAPVGDVELTRLRKIAGRDDFILWGMIPGAMFCDHFSDGAFRRHVREVLEVCGQGPMILGTADQIPPDGDVARVRVVADILAMPR